MAEGTKRPTAAGKKRLLLIEDEEVLLELLRARLVASGYDVTVARDGIAGLALVKDVKPDLVLLDMMLPGMSGFQILQKMKEADLLPATPVLIISNSGQPIELERALQLGVRDYLIKVNFDPHEVLMRVENILHAEKTGSRPEQKKMKKPVMGVHRTVLVVEDDFLLVGLLERKFLAEGYRVVKAIDAGEARSALASSAIDAILLDMVLPGMDGFAFLTELKQHEQWRAIPVVVISNLGQREEIDRGIRLGAAAYIVKANISPIEIVEKVGAILSK
ncbi:MAG: response regulator [Patescibacteria group bacterium]